MTSGVGRTDHGLATGLLNMAQQMGAAVGLALLATVAAARTAQTGSLAGGYALAFVVGAGFARLAALWVASRLNRAACQAEHARQEAVSS